MDSNNTQGAQAGASAVASDASAASGTVNEAQALEQINKTLGKQYPDMKTALKSIGDTFSYVGMKKEDIAKELSSSAASSNTNIEKELRDMKADLFYSKNPQYEPYKGIISKIGDNPADVVLTEEFKNMFDKAAGFDKEQGKKSVLESSSRIGQVEDKKAKINEAMARYDYNTAEKLALDAIVSDIEARKSEK